MPRAQQAANWVAKSVMPKGVELGDDAETHWHGLGGEVSDAERR